MEKTYVKTENFQKNLMKSCFSFGPVNYAK